MAPIKLAMLGAGIFARDAHLPALLELADQFEIAAIYSRSAARAAALAAALPQPVPVFTDLAQVLARPEIEAVDAVLPIPVIPGVVAAALQAGKHVLSEKPVAPTVAEGRRLLETAARLQAASGRAWMVAENYRYLQAYRAAAQAIQDGAIGRPLQAAWVISVVQNPANKYYHTAWRRDNSFPGGFVLDAGIHDMAALRIVLGEVESAAAFITQARPDLPPADTLSATLRFESGAFGLFGITFAASAEWQSTLIITGEAGALHVDHTRLETLHGEQKTIQEFPGNSIQAELADFARAVRTGSPPLSTPLEALRDVALMEALFNSARTGAIVHPERVS